MNLAAILSQSQGPLQRCVRIAGAGKAHGKALEIQSCVGGGDAFSTSAFECSDANKCLVSYSLKGRAWQGFSQGFRPGDDPHIWTATPTDYAGTMVHTDHDVNAWHTISYVFPVGDISTAADMARTGASTLTQVHFMLEV